MNGLIQHLATSGLDLSEDNVLVIILLTIILYISILQKLVLAYKFILALRLLEHIILQLNIKLYMLKNKEKSQKIILLTQKQL